MKLDNLNGIRIINISYLEEKKDIVYFGNIKTKKLQSLSKIYKYQNILIVERKEPLDVILLYSTAFTHILWQDLWN